MSRSSSPITKCPTFASGLFFELRGGFFLSSSPDIDLSNPKFRSDSNSWIRLAALLESAKTGDFRDCHQAADIVSNCQDPSVWHAWSMFIGHVCPITVVQRAIDLVLAQYPGETPDLVYDHISSMIAASQQLSLLPIVVNWHAQRRHSELGELLAFRLGQLLEPEWGDISENELPNEVLSQLIENASQRLYKEGKSENIAIRGGELFSPERTARRMLDIVKSSERDIEDFIDDRMIFEATTGIDLGPCFKDGIVQPLRAAAILEHALSNSSLDRFHAGERYFFGHLIPSS